MATASRSAKGLFVGAQLIERQTGVQSAYATGDVEADAAARDHTTFIRIKRRHTTDGKTITPSGRLAWRRRPAGCRAGWRHC